MMKRLIFFHQFSRPAHEIYIGNYPGVNLINFFLRRFRGERGKRLVF